MELQLRTMSHAGFMAQALDMIMSHIPRAKYLACRLMIDGIFQWFPVLCSVPSALYCDGWALALGS
jgi:hypothetical protein